MIGKKLTYQDICRHAEDTYRTLLDRKEWPPARNVRDSRGPPTSFGNFAVACETPLTRAEVLNLIQTRSNHSRSFCSSSTRSGNCHKCGKPGHWANECPDTKSLNPSENQNTANRRDSRSAPRRMNRHNGNRRNDNATPSWRTTPPGPTNPTTKLHNNKSFNWCAKCHRWTTTHTTSTHTGQKNNHAMTRNPPARVHNSGSSAAIANLSLIHDPSV